MQWFKTTERLPGTPLDYQQCNENLNVRIGYIYFYVYASLKILATGQKINSGFIKCFGDFSCKNKTFHNDLAGSYETYTPEQVVCWLKVDEPPKDMLI